MAELPSTRLRIKTVVLSRNVYNVCGIVIGTLQPRFMNPTAWNWRGKTAFFWAGANLLGLVWTYFRLPEPKVCSSLSSTPTGTDNVRVSPMPISMFSSRITSQPANSARSKSIHTARTTSFWPTMPDHPRTTRWTRRTEQPVSNKWKALWLVQSRAETASYATYTASRMCLVLRWMSLHLSLRDVITL